MLIVWEVVYDGRLQSDAPCSFQKLGQGVSLGGTGLRYVPVEHLDKRTVSPEKVERIPDELARLVGLIWTNREGQPRPLDVADILIGALVSGKSLVRELAVL